MQAEIAEDMNRNAIARNLRRADELENVYSAKVNAGLVREDIGNDALSRVKDKRIELYML